MLQVFTWYAVEDIEGKLNPFLGVLFGVFWIWEMSGLGVRRGKSGVCCGRRLREHSGYGELSREAAGGEKNRESKNNCVKMWI